METRKIIILGVMLVMGGGIFYAINSLGAPAAPVQAAAPQVKVQKVEYVSVLAINTNLSTGRRISEDMLTSIRWPAEALTDSLINLDSQPDAKSEFIGSLARQPLSEGETLTHAKIIKAGDGGVLSALLKPGMRAVTTRISVDTAAGGFIQPGDKVDIIMRESLPVRRNNSRSSQNRSAERNSYFVAQTLFENVKVMAIDQTFTTNPETGAAIPGSTATFELSQEDAELLQEAEGYGDLYLTLRGVNGSGYKGRSAAVNVQEEVDVVDPGPTSLTIYRNGEPSPVALQQRN